MARTALTSERLRLLQHLETASNHLDEPPELAPEIETLRTELEAPLAALEDHRRIAEDYPQVGPPTSRWGKDIPVETTTPTLSGLDLPRAGAPGHLRLGRPAWIGPRTAPNLRHSWGLPVQAGR